MANKNDLLTIEDGVVTACDKQAEEIVIHDGVTKIGEGAFESCYYLTSVKIPGP